MKVLEESGLAYFWQGAREWIDQRIAAWLPKGSIVMWSGSDIPNGWALCDGTNGTPDLRGRFVLGVSDSHKLKTKGGTEEVTLEVEQMPEHQHFMNNVVGFTKTESAAKGGTGDTTLAVYSGRIYFTDAAGESQPHNNMPPYYTLAYIMKL